MEGLVKPGHLVVKHVPDKVLEVKEQEAGEDVPQQAVEARSLRGVADWPPVPVQDGQWENVHHVVVEGQRQAAPHHGPGDQALLLYPVLSQQCHFRGEEIQQQKRQAEAQVHGE